VSGPEAKIKAACRKWLRAQGFYVSPANAGPFGAQTLDDLCCIRGSFVAIEYKAPGKMPTKRQTATIAEINAAGGIAFYADSVERVKKYINDHVLEGYDGNV